MKKHAVILLFALLCFSACKTKQKPAHSSVVIDEKEWVAIQLGENAIALNSQQLPTLKLSQGKASGFASCNRFHGTYTLEGNTLSFGQLVQTKMFCQETNTVETDFLNALSQTKRWEYKNGKLYFLGENNKTLTVFEEKTSSL
ncbi:MAG: META domain-containing protein [Bacteroidales bacterium]|jgi:heat shock protein HslJ|nr:META domain-containing protein [Bacteroidales bacterium]